MKAKEIETNIKMKEKEINELKTKLSNVRKECRALKSAHARALKKEAAEEIKTKPYRDLLLDAMIIGAKFTVRHGMVAPHSHDYYVTSKYVKEGYCRTISCGNPWYENLPKMTYEYLIKNGWGKKEFKQLQKDVDAAWAAFPTSYHASEYTPKKNDYLRTNHIANGYETDGFANIIKGCCGGTYSSYTTSSQNNLSRNLIILKGFGLDYYSKYQDMMQRMIPKELIEDVYSRHNISFDIDDIEKWCKQNPTRCMPDSPYFIDREKEKEDKND